MKIGAVVAATAMATLPTAALAARYPVGNGEANSIGVCANFGSYHNGSYGELSNGVLRSSDCYRSDKVTSVLVQYSKTGGGVITAKFGWQWIARDGAPVGAANWGDNFTIGANQSKYQQFYYSNGLAIPSSTPCVQGLLKVGTTKYVTRVFC
jgi:hypothetical protein